MLPLKLTVSKEPLLRKPAAQAADPEESSDEVAVASKSSQGEMSGMSCRAAKHDATEAQSAGPQAWRWPSLRAT